MTTTTHSADALRIALQIRQTLATAHDNTCDGFHAIEALQRTDLWQDLPIETRRVLCAAHAHLGVLADALAGIV
jgi:hypothetical protein